LSQALQQLAPRVGCEAKDMVFTPNATQALYSVIHSFPLSAADSVFVLNIGYGSVKKMLSTRCAAVGATVVVGEVLFPLPPGAEEDALVQLVEASLPPTCRLAVFDAVTSNTALVLPLRRLVAMCHARGCRVLIDGAHALVRGPS
jgi:isopenicillin-N epimerase